MTGTEIVKQFRITNPLDIVELNIIDLHRFNGYWDDPKTALDSVFSWLENFAVATIYEINDYDKAPKREDWPGWEHVGQHVHTGQRFYDWFLWYHPDAKLYFSDEPDFCGEYPDGGLIYGDVGRVSVSSFMTAQMQLGKGDVWISVQDGGRRQVMIEIEADRFPRSYRGKVWQWPRRAQAESIRRAVEDLEFYQLRLGL